MLKINIVKRFGSKSQHYTENEAVVRFSTSSHSFTQEEWEELGHRFFSGYFYVTSWRWLTPPAPEDDEVAFDVVIQYRHIKSRSFVDEWMYCVTNLLRHLGLIQINWDLGLDDVALYLLPHAGEEGFKEYTLGLW